MNYFAHLVLSNQYPNLMFGNYVGDIISFRDLQCFSPDIRSGIQLHQKIDRFTDINEYNRQVVQLLQSHHGRYAPVISDVFYDYCLCKHWDYFNLPSKQLYKNYAYQVLTIYSKFYTNYLPPYAFKMVESQWLNVYEDYDGLMRVFGALENRVSKPSSFHGVILTLQDLEVQILELFDKLFVALKAEVDREILHLYPSK